VSTTDNEQIASGVSQSSGTTAEELVKRKQGEYADPVGDKAVPKDQQKSTVNPFSGVK
jgi:hypothetical protein